MNPRWRNRVWACIGQTQCHSLRISLFPKIQIKTSHARVALYTIALDQALIQDCEAESDCRQMGSFLSRSSRFEQRPVHVGLDPIHSTSNLPSTLRENWP